MGDQSIAMVGELNDLSWRDDKKETMWLKRHIPPSLAEEKHFTVYSKRSNMFTTTKVNRVLSEIHVSSEKKMPCSFVHIHSNFVLSPDFWCGKKVDCRMFFDCLATTWGNRHLLFMADGAWVPWTEPMNLMAVQSAWPPGMHVWNIYKTLQLMGSFTLPLNWCRTFFSELNLQHHTSPLLDFRQMWCQGDQGRSKQRRRSLRLKLKKSYGHLHLFTNNVNSQLVVLHFLTETFFSKMVAFELFCLGVRLCGGRWGCVIHNSCNEVWKLSMFLRLGRRRTEIVLIWIRSGVWDDCHQDPAEEPFGVLRSWQVGGRKIRKNFLETEIGLKITTSSNNLWQFHIFGFMTHDLQCWFDMMWHDV